MLLVKGGMGGLVEGLVFFFFFFFLEGGIGWMDGWCQCANSGFSFGRYKVIGRISAGENNVLIEDSIYYRPSPFNYVPPRNL